MRFDRCKITKEPYQRNLERRLGAASRFLQKERDKLPLFADQMALGTPKQRLVMLDEGYRRWAKGFRHFVAQTWCRCRRALVQLPVEKRRALLEEWDNNRWLPGESDYFADFLRKRGVTWL